MTEKMKRLQETYRELRSKHAQDFRELDGEEAAKLAKLALEEEKYRKQYRSNLSKVVKFLSNINLKNPHIQYLKQTPFFNFLHPFIKKKANSSHLIGVQQGLVEILSTYDRTEEKFIIGGQELQIEPKEVEVILGISSGTKEVIIRNCGLLDSDLGRRRFARFKGKKISSKRMKEVLEITVEGTEETDIQDTVKIIILHTLSCVLFVASSDVACYWQFQYCDNLDTLWEFNWAEAVVNYLNQNMKTKPLAKVRGCTALLQFWFCERTTLIKPVKPDAFPRFLRWDLTKLKDALEKHGVKNLKAKKVKHGSITPTIKELETISRKRSRTDLPSTSRNNEKKQKKQEASSPKTQVAVSLDIQKYDSDQVEQGYRTVTKTLNFDAAENRDESQMSDLKEKELQLREKKLQIAEKEMEVLHLTLKKQELELEVMAEKLKAAEKLQEKLEEATAESENWKQKYNEIVKEKDSLEFEILHLIDLEKNFTKKNDDLKTKVKELEARLKNGEEKANSHMQQQDNNFRTPVTDMNSETNNQIQEQENNFIPPVMDIKTETNDIKDDNRDTKLQDVKYNPAMLDVDFDGVLESIQMPSFSIGLTPTEEEMEPEENPKTDAEIQTTITSKDDEATEDPIQPQIKLEDGQEKSNQIDLPIKLQDGQETGNQIEQQKNSEDEPGSSRHCIDIDYEDAKDDEDNAVENAGPIATRTRSHHENVTPPPSSAVQKYGKNITKYNAYEDVSRDNQVTLIFLSEMRSMRGCMIWWDTERDIRILYNDIFATLQGDCLSSDIINAYSRILFQQQQDGSLTTSDSTTLYGSTFVFDSLILDEIRRKDGIFIPPADMTTHRYLIFPTLHKPGKNTKGAANHWTVTVFDTNKGEWKYYNSLRPRAGRKDNYIQEADELKTAFENSSSKYGIPVPWEMELIPVTDSPQQLSNSVDCGVVVLYIIEKFFRQEPLDEKLEAADFDEMRGKIVDTILTWAHGKDYYVDKLKKNRKQINKN